MKQKASCLEWVRAEDGSPILVREGRLLSSQINPWRDAHCWLKGLDQEALAKMDTLVILGLGGIFHIRALQEKLTTLNLIVVEFDPATVDEVQKVYGEHFQEVKIYQDHQQLDSLLTFLQQRTYMVVSHFPSIQFSQNSYQAVANFLAGRDCDSLQTLSAQCKMAHFAASCLVDEVRATSAKILSIRDLDLNRGLRKHPENSRQFRFWRILEELIR